MKYPAFGTTEWRSRIEGLHSGLSLALFTQQFVSLANAIELLKSLPWAGRDAEHLESRLRQCGEHFLILRQHFGRLLFVGEWLFRFLHKDQYDMAEGKDGCKQREGVSSISFDYSTMVDAFIAVAELVSFKRYVNFAVNRCAAISGA